MVRGQVQQQCAPAIRILWQFVLTGAVKGQGSDLNTEGVPGLALVRAQGREGDNLVTRQRGKGFEEIQRSTARLVVGDPDHW